MDTNKFFQCLWRFFRLYWPLCCWCQTIRFAHASNSSESLGASTPYCSCRAYYELPSFLGVWHILYMVQFNVFEHKCESLPLKFYWILSKIIVLCKYYCGFLTVLNLRKLLFCIGVGQLHRACYNCHLEIKCSCCNHG